MLTPTTSKIFTWVKRILITLLLLEFIYLLVFNILLNTTSAQKTANQIKPETLQVTWGSAWTLFPGTIHFNTLSLEGKTHTKQWQADAKNASVSISLLSLTAHTIEITMLKVNDTTYQQYSKSTQSPSTTTPSKKKLESKIKIGEKNASTWQISLKNIALYGDHILKIDKVKADIEGNINADLSFDGKDKPFSIRNAKMNINLNTLVLHNNPIPLKESRIKGHFTVDPFMLSQTKGNEILNHLSLESEISAQIDNLETLNIYLKQPKGLQLKGKGQLEGKIYFEKGKWLPGTKVKLDTSELSLHRLQHKVVGGGQVALNVTKEHPKDLNTTILFNNFQAYYEDKDPQTNRKILLFEGKGLSIKTTGSPHLSSMLSKQMDIRSFDLEIPLVSIDDMSQFQHYISTKLPYTLQQGKGQLQAKIKLLPDALHATIGLKSSDTHIKIKAQKFQSDLDLLLKLEVPSIQALNADLSGSHIILKNLYTSTQAAAQETNLTIANGSVALHLSDLPQKSSTIHALLAEIKKYRSEVLRENTDAALKITGNTSRLDWIDLLLKNRLDLAFKGSGDIKADLQVKNGLLTTQSAIRITPKNLEVTILDYLFRGDGTLILDVLKGGKHPDIRLNLNLSDALLLQENSKETVAEDITLNLQGLSKQPRSEAFNKTLELQMKILSGKLKNITIYNQYFPKSSPLTLTKGTGDLKADLLLKPNDIRGYLTLKTQDLTMKIDKQDISAEMTTTINLSGGNPQTMDFNISGSSIVLDKVNIIGSTTDQDQAYWSASVKLDKAQLLWKKPIKLHSENTIIIKDMRPLISLISQQFKIDSWISDLLTIKDIHGHVNLDINKDIITIPYAFIKSDTFDMGAKGIITPELRDNILYFRYKRFKGLLKTRNGKGKFDIFGVDQKFNDYKIPSL